MPNTYRNRLPLRLSEEQMAQVKILRQEFFVSTYCDVFTRLLAEEWERRDSVARGREILQGGPNEPPTDP